ncbi:MAG: hypothetical protein LQ345_001921 [Seirophora villosa]|nr:MAG: hypothetical protein LQ345_001921 [Seirophora villosa]
MLSIRLPHSLCAPKPSIISKTFLCSLHSQSLPFTAPAHRPYGTKPHLVARPPPKRSPIAATTSAHPPKDADTLNPPASTLPPPLTLPTRDPADNRLVSYFRIGKAYVAFYKSGVKAIYHNYTLAKQIRPRLAQAPSPEQALRDGLVSRAEYHLARRTQNDVSRIPLFALVLLICGEFTPLVVVFMGLTGVVPRTCHIPRQIEAAQRKLEERRRESFRDGTVTMTVGGGAAAGGTGLDGLQDLPKPILAHVGRSLGLYSTLWDRLRVPPTFLLPRRIRSAVEKIDVDDLAIGREGGVKGLSEEELKVAAEARGLDVVGKPSGVLRSVLEMWMQARKRTSIIDLLSRRPSAWPQR